MWNFFPKIRRRKMGTGSRCPSLQCQPAQPRPWAMGLGVEGARGQCLTLILTLTLITQHSLLSSAGRHRPCWGRRGSTCSGAQTQSWGILYPAAYSSKQCCTLTICVCLWVPLSARRGGEGEEFPGTHTEGPPKELWAVDMELMSLYS